MRKPTSAAVLTLGASMVIGRILKKISKLRRVKPERTPQSVPLDAPTILHDDNFSLTLWGAPADLAEHERRSILTAVTERNASDYAGRAYTPGQTVERNEFTVHAKGSVHRVRYELTARRFLVAVRTVSDAIQWIHQQPNMDPDVARITQAHLLRELGNEYEQLKKNIRPLRESNTVEGAALLHHSTSPAQEGKRESPRPSDTEGETTDV